MAYSDDLLEQAKSLAEADPRRPKQANVRRAVSAAYYALFHEIVDRTIASLLPGAEATGLVGTRLRRTVQHTSLLRAAKWFAGTNPHVPGAIAAMRTSGEPVDPNLAGVCQVLVDLQSARHRADYDLRLTISRSEALRRISDADAAIASLRALQPRGDTLVFFLGCLLGEGLTKNA